MAQDDQTWEAGERRRLQLLTWPDIEEYLQTSRSILIPIGSTEQHGPTGLLGTDALCPEVLSRGVAARTGALIAPTLSIGMAQHHLGFPGSISLRPSTLIAVVRDVVTSLASQGFERFFFVNGHGGNIATLQAAFSEIHADVSYGVQSNRASLQFQLHSWWMLPSVRARSAELFGEAEGSHVTCSEVSLTHYAHGPHMKSRPLSPKIAPKGPIGDARDFRSRFPDGRIGSDPTLANAEAGETLYEAALEDLCGAWENFTRTSE
ncbi:creatininase family protein [Fodinicurvata fenggangensis]|uniref:creatininase family protein n=1 Tax=Fodinicurvata fenggangensis TaxID=1121830 RepID=UPI000690B960|nr:creatininase family protein [Fodinicurvata fenggangensis]